MESLLLILEAKKTIRTIRSVSSVYTFLHSDFEGVDYYTARQYVHLTREVREEHFFVSDEK